MNSERPLSIDEYEPPLSIDAITLNLKSFPENIIIWNI